MDEKNLVTISVWLASIIGLTIVAISAVAASNILAIRLHETKGNTYVFQSASAEKTRQWLQHMPWIVFSMFLASLSITTFLMIAILYHPGLKADWGAVLALWLAAYCVIVLWMLVWFGRRSVEAFKTRPGS